MKKFTFNTAVVIITAVLILLVSIFLIFIQADNPQYSTAQTIQTAFYSTGAKLVTSEIYIQGKLASQAFANPEQRRLLLTDIIRAAGGETGAVKPVFDEIDTDGSTGTQVDYIISNDCRLQGSVLCEKKGNVKREYRVIVSLVNTSQEQKPAEAASAIEAQMKKYSGSTSLNFCITGSMDGILSESEIDAICGKILESTGANKVEGLKEKELVSVSAFSPSIGSAVRVNGKSINLNVAVRYNSYEGKTYIWLASPVITTEY